MNDERINKPINRKRMRPHTPSFNQSLEQVLDYLPSLLYWRHQVLGTTECPSSERCVAEIRECELGLRANVLRGVSEFADVLYYATKADLRNPRLVACFLRLLHELKKSSWYEALKLIHGKWSLGMTADGPLATKPYSEIKALYSGMAAQIASLMPPRLKDELFTWRASGSLLSSRVRRLSSLGR